MTALRRERPRTFGWLALGVTWGSVAISGCSPQADAQKAPPPPVVGVVEAKRMTVPIMAEPIGTTKALQEVSIRARVRGFLQEMHFEEGGDVKAGQLLFVIDEAPFQAKLAEARAKLEAAEAALKRAQDSKAREVATAQVKVNQAVFELNKVEEGRQVALIRKNAVARADVDQATAVRKRSEAQVEADLAALEQAKADHETNILAAQAEVAAAQAGVLDAEINLGYCRMSAPIDGRIGLAQVELGNLVGPAAGGGGSDYTELAVIRQLDPMGVDIQVSSRYLDRVARLIGAGLAVEVFRPGLEGEEDIRFPGRATTIDNTINATTSTFLLRAEVANPARTILPGEYVKAKAKIGEARDAVVVPEQAVVESQAGPTVYTVDSKGKVVVTPVRATFIFEGLRVLESGLQPDQQVIVEGLQLVRSGMTVKTRPAELAAPTAPEGPAVSPPDTDAPGDAQPAPPTPGGSAAAPPDADAPGDTPPTPPAPEGPEAKPPDADDPGDAPPAPPAKPADGPDPGQEAQGGGAEANPPAETKPEP